MTWIFAFAFLTVIVVAVSVLPRRTPLTGFPWFWLAFPLTMAVVALAVGAWLPIHPTRFNFYGPYVQLVGGYTGSLWPFFFGQWAKYVYTVLAVVGAGLSAWAWRRGRI